ncbi:TolC family protein [Helicobacter saguini]|uniref:TolC family protein n=2 Tax=Helicobacter saguini TaxID=1548018 RepID=A0A347W0N0_9HELI|nr:TolC family protein [Helicobacter saguini]MWV67605.1 TolC family protein [Helicobacter saguini]MWV69956.1 TolC family protein [Helicobacter saguini]MWV72830.1 TolC family protein [Helicobacter saguini]TLD92396.1 TolC family protein [Helicobacter saguini]
MQEANLAQKEAKATELQLESVLRANTQSGKTLSELLKSAENNYSLQGQKLLDTQAQRDYLVSQLAFIPTLDGKYNFSKTSTSANFGYQSQNFQLAFNWTLDYATYEAMREKGATAKKANYDTQYARQSVYLQVVQQYYTYFNNESSLITLQQKLAQIQSDVDRVQKLYDQGLRTIADLESLKSQAATTKYEIDNATLALIQSKLMLEYLTNEKIDGLKRTNMQDPSLELNDRSDIKSLEFQIKALKHQNAQLHYYPSFTLQDTYTYNAQVPDFVTQMMAQGGGSAGLLANYATHNNVFGMNVTYQIFAKIGLSVQKQSFRLATIANEKNLAYKKAEQKKDEELYRKAIEVAKNQINSAKASLISANLSYDNMKKRYDANLVTFTEYLTALSTKYDAESTFIQALNNYEIQKANYIFYSGQDIEKYVK